MHSDFLFKSFGTWSAKIWKIYCFKKLKKWLRILFKLATKLNGIKIKVKFKFCSIRFLFRVLAIDQKYEKYIVSRQKPRMECWIFLQTCFKVYKGHRYNSGLNLVAIRFFLSVLWSLVITTYERLTFMRKYWWITCN